MRKRAESKRKAPREGFRRRINPWYAGMTKQQIARDVAKTAARWLLVTVLSFVYWLAMLLMLSMFLLNIWRVTIGKILLYSVLLCLATSLVYAGVLVHRKLYY